MTKYRILAGSSSSISSCPFSPIVRGTSTDTSSRLPRTRDTERSFFLHSTSSPFQNYFFVKTYRILYRSSTRRLSRLPHSSSPLPPRSAPWYVLTSATTRISQVLWAILPRIHSDTNLSLPLHRYLITPSTRGQRTPLSDH